VTESLASKSFTEFCLDTNSTLPLNDFRSYLDKKNPYVRVIILCTGCP
jgi:hypothetical protein